MNVLDPNHEGVVCIQILLADSWEKWDNLEIRYEKSMAGWNHQSLNFVQALLGTSNEYINSAFSEQSLSLNSRKEVGGGSEVLFVSSLWTLQRLLSGSYPGLGCLFFPFHPASGQISFTLIYN